MMGYVIRPMRDWADGLATEPRSILLRHDIDVSLGSIAPIDAIEADLHVQATYYVRTRAQYYDVSTQAGVAAMAALRAHGHEVGLHYEPDPEGQSEVAWDDASRAALAEDKDRLVAVAGEPMEGAAGHRPGGGGGADAGASALGGVRLRGDGANAGDGDATLEVSGGQPRAVA